MYREYVKWYSPHLYREMELLVFGHAGARVLVFPTRMGRFYEYEDWGLVAALEEQLAKGWLQLYCVDSVDKESLYNLSVCPARRLQRHIQYEQYILREVLPFTESKNSSPFLTACGSSLGAFHALNIATRHPVLFTKVVALSGRYDLTQEVEDFKALLGNCPDATVYFHSPNQFLANMHHSPHLDYLRRMEIILAVGKQDPFLASNRDLSRSLWTNGIWHALHEWEGRAHTPRCWRQMGKQYL